MPSSHSQVIFFLLGLEVFQFVRKAYRFHQSTWQKLGAIGMVLIYALASVQVAYSRVYLGYHDLSQVLAGAAAGVFAAAICFAFTAFAAGYFPAWQRSSIGRLLRLKNTWAINDNLLFEYNNTLSEVSNSRKIK